MGLNQFYPLETNPQTGEPFLRLPAPNQNIILTPPRAGDEAALLSILNDERIYRWMSSIPTPYLPHHAQSWVAIIKQRCDDILQELREEQIVHPDGPLKPVGDCPVRYLREVQADGSDVFIGDICIVRSHQDDVVDPIERATLVAENNAKPLGDPSICWSFGDFVTASYHGRGIMSSAMGLILNSWAIPRMGVRYMKGFAFDGNIASSRVFEKNGFVRKGLVDNGREVRGKRVIFIHLEWKYSKD
ncbi:hypothetical protein BJ138DRAFT_315403 [Hygrophoropsis aurantiaca]|uniref:Uncharacterized protein n=1 Tax=Hygrophoropsis aurantiaca TaxID=72124 RepID=A0ACB8ANA4_9AGAM|nr:hypothetical protein BJ138DRAFT_315403 [Hygrophoropsis aurantiaca]